MKKNERLQNQATDKEQMDDSFISYAASIIQGYQNSKSLAADFSKLAVQRNVTIPHPMGPAANKQTLVFENLKAFEGVDQFEFIKNATEAIHSMGKGAMKELRAMLLDKYSAKFGKSEVDGISQPLVEETKHWLAKYPEALRIYESAEEKYLSGKYHRNVLDDLRLCLESLLKKLIGNKKSLEKQREDFGKFLKEAGSSPELRLMLDTLLTYYSSYNNEYIKHNDAPPHGEVEIVFDLTSTFLKHLIRIDPHQHER